MDLNGHGTHVAGTIAAIANNLIGIAGMVPDSAILAVRALNIEGSGTLGGLVNGMIYAASRGAHVINNSWGLWFSLPRYAATNRRSS